MKKRYLIVAILFAVASQAPVWAQGWPQLKQGDYAEALVMDLKIQKQLPLAYNQQDCIDLLVSYGISPLKGWDKNALLSKDDYTSVVLKINGRERALHQAAQKICDQMVEKINAGTTGLSSACPYGEAYQQENGRTLQHRHLIDTPLKWALYPRK